MISVSRLVFAFHTEQEELMIISAVQRVKCASVSGEGCVEVCFPIEEESKDKAERLIRLLAY